MADNSDVYIAAKALITTIKSSFIFSEQLAVLESFLQELLGHLKTERDQKWPKIHTLTLVLKKLTYFLRVNLVVKERAPKELPILRKLRTILAINDLANEYQGYFRELQNVILTPEIRKKFSEGYLGQFLAEEEELSRISTDINQVISEFSRISLKTCFGKEDDIHDDLRQIKNDLKVSLEMEKGDKSFEVFNRNDFAIFLNDIDERLLIVNRNILMQVQTAQNSQKRLQKAIAETDLDYTEFESEDLSQRFKGVWGHFNFALYTQRISKQQRKRNRSAGIPPLTPKKVLVQRIAVHELNSVETTALGYNIRHFEMNSEEICHSKSILKFYGHYRISNDLFIVSESVQLNLAEIYESKRNHILTGKEVIKVALHVSNALKYLHYNAQIHGDIRPENIFFTAEGFKGDIKLGNFSHSLDKEKELFGAQESKRIAYKSPETVSDELKYESSDVYSLSIVVWNLLHPESLPYNYITSTADEIKFDITAAVKPMIKYEAHCKNLRESERLSPDDWSNVAEMLQFMWNQEPSDRPSSSLCYDFFKLQQETLGTTQARTSVFVVQEKSKREPTVKVEDPINEEQPPELPPRNSSVYSAGQFSKARLSSEADTNTSKHFRAYSKPLGRNARLPRVKSRGRMEPPTEYNKQQDKHDSEHVSTRDRSEVTKLKTNSQSVGLSQPTGVDNIPADKIKNELEMFRESLFLEGKNMDSFDLGEEVSYCLQHGLVEFHNKMRREHGRGLKRFESTGGPEIITLPGKKRQNSKSSKGDDDEVLGVAGMAKHLKKQRKKDRFSMIKRPKKRIELEKPEPEGKAEVLTLGDMALHLKQNLKKEKRFSINPTNNGSKIRRLNSQKKGGGMLKRVKSLRPFGKSRISRKVSLRSSTGGEITKPNLPRLMKDQGSKLGRNKRVSSTESSGPEV